MKFLSGTLSGCGSKTPWRRPPIRSAGLFDADTQPYTLQERHEAEALHAEIASLVERAETFNRMVTDRLSREVEDNAEKLEQLRRFRSAGRIKIEFAPF